MLEFLDKYELIKGGSAFGVEVFFNSKDTFTIIAVELIKIKNNVEIKNKWIDISIEELSSINLKKHPVYLSVGGKGIIHKKIKHTQQSNQQEFLNQILPNAKVEEFYLQRVDISDKESWVSIVRKESIDSLIQNFQMKNIFVVDMFLGPFVIGGIILYLSDESSILTTTYELIIEENEIIHMDNLGAVSGGREYVIDGEVIQSHEIIAFASAFFHFIDYNKLYPLKLSQIENIKKEYYYKRKYTVLGFSMLVLFFIITIINLLVSNYYQSLNNDLQYQVSNNQKYVEELNTLQFELKQKEAFVEDNGLTHRTKLSYFLDQVAMSLPEGIRLNSMIINPLEKKIKNTKDVHFLFNVINISGTVTKSVELNDWIKKINQYKWIGTIQLISFIQDDEQSLGEFEIRIEIK